MKSLTKNEKIAVGISLLVVGFFFIFGGILISIFKTGQLPGSGTNITADVSASTTPQVSIQDITLGTGDIAEPGETLTVNYIGTLADGTVFDSSVARKQPFTFTLGAGQVIPGWDQGLVGMKVGGQRVLVIPPELGYGSTNYGPIPGNSTLVFRIELESVSK